MLADGRSTDLGELALGQEHARSVHAVEWLQLRRLHPRIEACCSGRPFHHHPHSGTGVCPVTPSWGERSPLTSRTWVTLLSKLDESGIVYIGAEVTSGDILVGRLRRKVKLS